MIATGADRLVAELADRMPHPAVIARLRPDRSLYPRPSRRRARRNGLWFDLELSDYLQWSVYYSVEKDLRRKLFGLVQPGHVVIDVGSNLGEVLMNVARRAGPAGRAIGFEANPATYAECQANIALNGLTNAEVHRVGLGDAEGELMLGRPSPGNSGADRFAADGDIAVPITTLDLFAERHRLDRIDLIKIDVEGFEMKVLAGAEAVLRRFRPTMFIELSDVNLREQGSSAAELVGWLAALGYAVQRAEDNRLVSASDDLTGCFFDIICRLA